MVKHVKRFIDTFYFLFKGFMPLKTYRYAVCGGSNLILDLVLYFVFYHFIFGKQDVNLGFFTMSAHIASLFFVFPITFLIGFLLNRFITFDDSVLSAKTQFIRYLIISFGAIILSYILMKLFVDLMGFYPTPSKLVTTALTVVYSYILQSRFSFKAEVIN
jgi:putative flippase GtrA